MIEEISFEEIKQIWLTELWPGRQSKLGPVSRIDIDGEINMTMTVDPPIFVGIKSENQLVAVASGHPTGQFYRLRGLWVAPNYRQKHFATRLFNHLQQRSFQTHATTTWMMARARNLEIYKKMGFVVLKEISQYEFGPHFIMTRTWDKDAENAS
jgi:citrate lyase synthetase